MTQATFKNQFLSYSRLSRFEQCPRSFKYQYVDKVKGEPGMQLLFGSAIHEVLEDLIKEHVAEEECCVLSVERAMQLYQEIWAKNGMVGADIFHEGADIIRRFIAEQGILDSSNVLALEQRFDLRVGEFNVMGYIDRVDKEDDETIIIYDYKTNRMLFSSDEVDESLQMSTYQVACKELYPWAKKVKLRFWMLRHSVMQETVRTEDQLEDALRYIETLGKMTESATDYPARVNTNCGYCDHRGHCDAYAAVLKGEGRKYVSTDLEDLEAVARERNEVAMVAKIAYARKEELEKVLNTHLKNNDELTLAGTRFRMLITKSYKYPLVETAALLHVNAKSAGLELNASDIERQISSVDNKSMDALLKKITKGWKKPHVDMLKLQLEANAECTVSAKFFAQESK